jgi:hypothetical protein
VSTAEAMVKKTTVTALAAIRQRNDADHTFQQIAFLRTPNLHGVAPAARDQRSLGVACVT